MFGRRCAIAATTLGAVFSLALGLSGPASASVILYQNSNVDVRVSGGDVVALNACVADAKDGIIQTQILACNQVASAGNLVVLEGVSVWVTSATPPKALLYRSNYVNVSVTGGMASSINTCVADAQDAIVQTQIVACNQVASAGNLVNLAGVWVQVDQP
jgi:hypothetical protein